MNTTTHFSEDVSLSIQTKYLGEQYYLSARSGSKKPVVAIKFLIEFDPGIMANNLFIELRTSKQKSFIVLFDEFLYFYKSVKEGQNDH